MKLCRYGKNGFEKPGIIDSEGRLRDLSKVVENIGPKELSPRGLKMLAKVKPETLPVVANGPRLGVPFIGIGKFVAIGLNYSDHAKEAGMPIPTEPIVFMKATTCISGPNDDVIQPKRSTKLDWEVELGIVIGIQGAIRGREGSARVRRGLLRGERRLRARVPDGHRRNGTRARASTPPARSGPGWSPPTRSRTRRSSTCGSM